MAMAIDSRQQPQFGGMGYDPMRYGPQFTNPWVSAPPTSQSQMYATSLPATSVAGDVQRFAHAPNVSTAYSSAQIAAPSLATGIFPMDPAIYEQSGSQVAQDMTRPFGTAYTSAPVTSASVYAPTSAPQYTSAPYGYQTDRRTSHPSVVSSLLMGPEAQRRSQDTIIDISNRLNSASEVERQNFHDALDASRGMVAMSQSDITPRNIYANNNSSRSSVDSYGFPSSHSAHSSISSASTYPSYYNSSVSDASVADYSSASESVDIPNPRTLPRPNGLAGSNFPPAPSTMMGQFSSKVSSSSQKKHKCKICDKRFTRPSSLQTHMYSHTGEKPFACDVEGCGRHFSVVSNLRRHRKVHKGEGRDHPSPDDDE